MQKLNFIDIKYKQKWSNVDLWGTPHLIDITSEKEHDIKTNCCRFDMSKPIIT